MRQTTFALLALALSATPAVAEDRQETAELVLVSPDEPVEMRVDGVLKSKGTLATLETTPGTVNIEFRGSRIQLETVKLAAGERVMVVFSPNPRLHGYAKVLARTTEPPEPRASRPSRRPAAKTRLMPPAATPPVAARIESTAGVACASATDCGSIEILSPNVFGKIAINGDEVGYPPLIVKNVTSGVAKIEVRVDGTVQGLSEIKIQPGFRTKVIVLSRSQAMIYKKGKGEGDGAPTAPAGMNDLSASLPLQIVTLGQTRL